MDIKNNKIELEIKKKKYMTTLKELYEKLAQNPEFVKEFERLVREDKSPPDIRLVGVCSKKTPINKKDKYTK